MVRKNKIRRIKINRLFDGRASVRNYIVEKAQRDKEALLLECQGETMLLQPKDLDKGRQIIQKYFTSKWDDQPYCLIDYDWSPTMQLKLL